MDCLSPAVAVRGLSISMPFESSSFRMGDMLKSTEMGDEKGEGSKCSGGDGTRWYVRCIEARSCVSPSMVEAVAMISKRSDAIDRGLVTFDVYERVNPPSGSDSICHGLFVIGIDGLQRYRSSLNSEMGHPTGF